MSPLWFALSLGAAVYTCLAREEAERERRQQELLKAHRAKLRRDAEWVARDRVVDHYRSLIATVGIERRSTYTICDELKGHLAELRRFLREDRRTITREKREELDAARLRVEMALDDNYADIFRLGLFIDSARERVRKLLAQPINRRVASSTPLLLPEEVVLGRTIPRRWRVVPARPRGSVYLMDGGIVGNNGHEPMPPSGSGRVRVFVEHVNYKERVATVSPGLARIADQYGSDPEQPFHALVAAKNRGGYLVQLGVARAFMPSRRSAAPPCGWRCGSRLIVRILRYDPSLRNVMVEAARSSY